MATPNLGALQAECQRLREVLVLSIRAHDSRDVQQAHADRWINAIRVYARVSGKRFPIPNRNAILRQLANT